MARFRSILQHCHSWEDTLSTIAMRLWWCDARPWKTQTEMVRKVFGQLLLLNWCSKARRNVGRRRIPSQLLSRRSTLNKALPDVQEADHREVRYDGGTLGQNCIKMFGWNMLLILSSKGWWTSKNFFPNTLHLSGLNKKNTNFCLVLGNIMFS